jgi:SAM-dependent methyltransferase
MDGRPFTVEDGLLCSGPHRIPIRNGIPRFVPDVSYSGNFAMMREKHSTLQLDSRNGTTDRHDTLLERTGWPAEFFAGKTVLECGCGAGPDTEILLSLGCKVLSADLAGVDVARRNIGGNPRSQFIQASIVDLPLKKKSFDIVFCHRVLQHTPEPVETLEHILQFVRDDGAVFVHSYGGTIRQVLRWKYALRPLTRRLPQQFLYDAIGFFSVPLFHLTNFLNRWRIGRIFASIFVPFNNHRHLPKYKEMSDEDMIQYAIHDTFDALSPAHDHPMRAATMERIAAAHLRQPFEVVPGFVVLLRSKI